MSLSVTVMTFNLHDDQPSDSLNSWDNRKDLCISVITSHSPNVICTQQGFLFFYFTFNYLFFILIPHLITYHSFLLFFYFYFYFYFCFCCLRVEVAAGLPSAGITRYFPFCNHLVAIPFTIALCLETNKYYFMPVSLYFSVPMTHGLPKKPVPPLCLRKHYRNPFS